ETLRQVMIRKPAKEPHIESVAACPKSWHDFPVLVARKGGAELIPTEKLPGGVNRSQPQHVRFPVWLWIFLRQGCPWTNPCIIARADFVQDPLSYGRFIQPVTRVFIQRQLVTQRDLALVAQALDAFCLLLRPRQCGKQQPGEDRNDRDDDEQFDQRECRADWSVGLHNSPGRLAGGS